jgi:hypothetical protein
LEESHLIITISFMSQNAKGTLSSPFIGAVCADKSRRPAACGATSSGTISTVCDPLFKRSLTVLFSIAQWTIFSLEDGSPFFRQELAHPTYPLTISDRNGTGFSPSMTHYSKWFPPVLFLWWQLYRQLSLFRSHVNDGATRHHFVTSLCVCSADNCRHMLHVCARQTYVDTHTR